MLVSDCIMCDFCLLVEHGLIYVSAMYWFDFFQARMASPTHHPASTIQSPGSRFMSLLQKNPRVALHVWNLRENKNANKVPAPLFNWETLPEQDSFYRGHDAADWRLSLMPWLNYSSIVTSSRLITTALELCWITDVLMFSGTAVVVKAFHHLYIFDCFCSFTLDPLERFCNVQAQMSLYERIIEYLGIFGI